MELKEYKTEEKIKEIISAVYALGQVDNSVGKHNMSYELEDSFSRYIIKTVIENIKNEEEK